MADPRHPHTPTHTRMAARRAAAPTPCRRMRRGARLAAAAAVLAVVAAACGLAAVVTAAPAAAAPSLYDLQKEAKRTRTEMSSLQASLQQAGQDLVTAQARLDAVTKSLDAARVDLARAQNNLELQTQILANRAALLYKTGGIDWIDIISNLQSLSDIDTIRSMQRDIAEQDRIDENRAEQLTQQAQQLANQVDQDRQDAVAAAERVQSRKTELDFRLAQRAQILQEVTKRIKKILASGGLQAALAMARNGQFTQVTWARALLIAMRLPVTADNVAAITAWEMAEGGQWYNAAHYNPLNTTMDMPGATIFNSVGVKAYTSWKEGLEATVKTLKNGLYSGIIDALRRGNDDMAVAHAVGASPWGTGDFSHLL